MFHVDPEDLLHAAVNFYSKNGSQCIFSDEKAAADPENHTVRYCFGGKTGTMTVICPKWGIPLGTLQAFLDDYLEQHSEAKIDYIHGEDVVSKLGNEAGNMGFFLPDIEKNDLFRGVIIDGVLPRKTFSMGEAHEKRYYMESKMIIKSLRHFLSGLSTQGSPVFCPKSRVLSRFRCDKTKRCRKI